MRPGLSNPLRYVEAIRRSGLSIYDPIEVGHPELWIPSPDLEVMLDRGLQAIRLKGLALRTRSKVVKQHVCRTLGYPIPNSFKKTQPRFPGQLLDTYIQKSNNLQIWNQELAPTRRYAMIRVSPDDAIVKVKVVTGDSLAPLNTTGTLTQKYQARCIPGASSSELVIATDTNRLRPLVATSVDLKAVGPLSYPCGGQLLSIAAIFERLRSLASTSFDDAGYDQERNRGAILHRLVCKALGYINHADDGRFPDVRHQLLEVKLQTSPTIDLGLVKPDRTEPLDLPKIQGRQIRHCDVRYAIFYGHTDGKQVTLTHLFLTTGEAFFQRFPQFQGKILNKKLQIPLPADFFDR